MPEKSDRDFMIAIRNNFPAGNIATESKQEEDLHDHIPPIDVYINAIHRMCQLQIVPDSNFTLLSTISVISRQDLMTLDGLVEYDEITNIIDEGDIAHFIIPTEIDYMVFFFNNQSLLGETIFSSEFYDNFRLDAAEAGRISNYPDVVGSALLVGEVDLITVLELTVR